MSLRTRLGRLEQRCDGHGDGCIACRHRQGHTVLVTPRWERAASPDDWPEPCPRCGDVPEQIIEIVEVVVETHEQALAALAESASPIGGG